VDAKNYQLCNILIVDDNEISGALVRLHLTRVGHHVIYAESGPRALEIINREKIDVVLLDLRMPGMSGMEVLEKIRERHSMLSLPVIMVTADDREQQIVECLELGANDYVVKPISVPVTLARVNAQLNARNLSRLKDEFLSFASHDLKKPLIVIRDIIENLQENLEKNQLKIEDTRELLHLVHKSATNMQNVVENFLDAESLNRDDAHRLKLKPVQLNQLIANTVEGNQNYAVSKKVELNTVLDLELPEIEADPFYVAQILDNLVGNALKFSPPNSITCITTYLDKDFIYTEIRDTGPGLSESDLKNIFQRHTVLSNKPTGHESSSGIGLKLAKKLVEMHGGVIGARNNDEVGATFWFKLPVKQFEHQDETIHTNHIGALQ